MAKTLQLRRYNTSTLSSTTGAAGEPIVDTTTNSLTIHDGSTAGGTRLATESYVTSQGYITDISSKQNTLVSGTNIKTINGSSILGSGDLTISGGGSTGNFVFSGNTITTPLGASPTLNVSSQSSTAYNFASPGLNYSGSSSAPQGNATGYLWYGLSISASLYAALQATPSGTKMTIKYSSGAGATSVTEVFTFTGVSHFASYWVGFQEAPSQSVDSMTTISWSAAGGTSNVTYQFTSTGTFTTTSLFAGQVLVSNNIVTPVTINSYGVATTGINPLIINGNLSVLGDITNNNAKITGINYSNLLDVVGSSRPNAIANGKILQANKKYRITTSGTVVLPSVSTLSEGDTIEIAFLYDTGSLSVFVYETSTAMVGWSGLTTLGSVSVDGSSSYNNATIGYTGATVKFIYYTPSGGTTKRWMVTL